MIPIFKPWYDEREEVAVINVLRSGWVGLGPVTEKFENQFAQRIGAKYAVSVNSCTAALHIASEILGVHIGDEVIVPTITFVSTAHIVSYCGATPIFCDINIKDMLLNWDNVKSKITNKTKLIIPVLYGGQPLDDIPNFGIPMLFDCAHACGANWSVKGKTCCWSFHAVKNLACGDGGMITTDDEDIYRKAKIMRWMGINKGTWDRTNIKYNWEYNVETIGYKYHGNDILSAIGLIQLHKLDEARQKRLQIVKLYNENLKNLVETPEFNSKSSFHLYVIRTNNRDKMMKYLMDKGIHTGIHYKPIHFYKVYASKENLPIAETVWNQIITLPLFPTLSLDEVAYICDNIKTFIKENT